MAVSWSRVLQSIKTKIQKSQCSLGEAFTPTPGMDWCIPGGASLDRVTCKAAGVKPCGFFVFGLKSEK
jgi:hypothetical protein